MPYSSDTQLCTSLCVDLVEKAYWQLALTDSDDKLERALGRLLAPVLLKASSKDLAVRDKVLCMGWLHNAPPICLT